VKYFVHLDGNEIALDIAKEGNNFMVLSDNRNIPGNIIRSGDGYISTIIGGKHFGFFISDDDNETIIHTGFRKLRAQVLDERDKILLAFAVGSEDKSRLADLRAPMPGLVVRIMVANGQQFKRGDGLIVVQAMKMENELKALHDGVVKEVEVVTGQAIEKNQTLMTFE